MKKITLLLVGVLVSASSFAFRRADSPSGKAGMAVVKSTSNSYKLIYKSELASDVKVKIFDSRNTLVFSETIKKSAGFARPYNFESLAEGEYVIKIDNGSNWMTETIDYRAGKIESLAHLAPLKDGRYLLTVANKAETQLTVRIFGKDGNILYTKVDNVAGDFGQIYNLSHVEGPFSFEISGSNGMTQVLNK